MAMQRKTQETFTSPDSGSYKDTLACDPMVEKRTKRLRKVSDRSERRKMHVCQQ